MFNNNSSINMGLILNLLIYSYVQDAVMVFKSAINKSPNTSLLHFMLANAKAVHLDNL